MLYVVVQIENGPHRLIYLIVWSLAGKLFRED